MNNTLQDVLCRFERMRGRSVLWQPVLLGVAALLLVAVVWSRLYPGLARYPVDPLAPSPPTLNWGGWGP